MNKIKECTGDGSIRPEDVAYIAKRSVDTGEINVGGNGAERRLPRRAPERPGVTGSQPARFAPAGNDQAGTRAGNES